jgi:hypothetical protein
MREDARLGWDGKTLDNLIKHVQKPDDLGNVIACRVDANHSIAAALQQTIKETGCNASSIVCRMVGLQPGGEPLR